MQLKDGVETCSPAWPALEVVKVLNTENLDSVRQLRFVPVAYLFASRMEAIAITLEALLGDRVSLLRFWTDSSGFLELTAFFAATGYLDCRT